MANGHPPVCCAASGCTRSRMRGGLASSVYFLSCQLLTTAPRFENSTRYRSFSTTIVRSCVSAFASIATFVAFFVAAEILLVVFLLGVAAPVLGGGTAA